MQNLGPPGMNVWEDDEKSICDSDLLCIGDWIVQRSGTEGDPYHYKRAPPKHLASGVCVISGSSCGRLR